MLASAPPTPARGRPPRQWCPRITRSHRCLFLQALQLTLSENVYNPKKVNDWTNAVIDQCLKGLQALGKPFKYIGTHGPPPALPRPPTPVRALDAMVVSAPCPHARMAIVCADLARGGCSPVTCIIMQKNGAGLYTTATTFWDTKKDGTAAASSCCTPLPQCLAVWRRMGRR